MLNTIERKLLVRSAGKKTYSGSTRNILCKKKDVFFCLEILNNNSYQNYA